MNWIHKAKKHTISALAALEYEEWHDALINLKQASEAIEQQQAKEHREDELPLVKAVRISGGMA